MANRTIPQNIIFIWPSENGLIPADWSRETTLDDKFIKAWGDSTAPNNTGGNDSHTHVGNTHTHTKTDSHTHTVSTNSTNATEGRVGGSTNRDPTAFSNHNHNNGTSSSTTGGDASSAVTYPADSSTNNRPPYHDLIFIKAGASSTFSIDMIGFWNTTTAPGNWRFCTDGSNGSPALGNKYPRGATTSGDAGTTGGSLTHTHDLSHTHSTTHSHGGSTGGPTTTQNIYNEGTGMYSSMNHTHPTTWGNVTITTGTYSATLTSGTIEPAYKKLLGVQRQADGETAPTGLIGLWLGATGSIPAGWTLCDGTGATPDMRDKFVKFANATGELGNTGGANTHDHAASNSHGSEHNIGAGHTHSTSVGNSGESAHGTGSDNTPRDHNHSVSATGGSSTSMTFSSTSMSAQTTTGDGNQPPFRTNAFIMLTTTFDIGSDNSSKAWIYYKDVSWSSSAIAKLREGVAHSFVKADIIRKNEQNPSSVKATIMVVHIYDQISSKQNIVTTTPVSSHIKFSISSTSFQKGYEYRVYDAVNLSFITAWSKEVISEPIFRMVINGGPGELIVQLDRTFDDFGEDVDVKLFNRVEVWCFDRDSVNGVRIYNGYISGYRPIFEGSRDYVEITLLPYVAQLGSIMLRTETGATEVSQSTLDPSTIAKNVIDYARADGAIVSYTDSTVDDTATVVSYTFQSNTVKEALDKIIELTPENWYWRMDADNMFYLKLSNINKADYNFLIGKHISGMEIWRRGEDIINRIYFVGGETAGVNLYRVYSNSGSISSYGIHAYKYVDQRVTLTGTADILANRILNKKKDPEVRTIITLLDNNGHPDNIGYDIESVKPGQTFRIRNMKEPKKTVTYWDVFTWDQDVWDQTLAYQAADIIQIQSIEYHPNYLRIEASSRLPEIAKRVEDVYRNLEQTQTLANPTTPTVV